MNFENLQADLVNHPIEGYLHTGQRLSVPLISHIEDNLYVGGCVNGVDLGDFFTHIFSLYPWERYAHGENTVLVETRMYDSHDGVDVETVEELSQRVSDALDEGGNVLVHCQAGINRSNLIAAATLVRRGRTPVEAITLLRDRRSELVLANSTFVRYLVGE